MHTSNFKRGQSLIEILFAVTLFTIGVVTIGYVILDSFVALRYGIESTQARALALEGIEAIRSLRDNSFESLSEGTYGLVLLESDFILTPEPDLHGKYSRTVTILDIDDELKEVTATVTWDLRPGQEKSISLTTKFSNWGNTKGGAQNLGVAIDALALTASGTTATGIALYNTGDEDFTITEMRLAWNTPARLSGITIGEVEVFSATTSPVESGTTIDIVDFVLGMNSGPYPIDSIVFDSDVQDAECIVTMILGDGSKRHVSISL